MQNIVFYVDASKTLGTVTNITNNRNEYAPTLVLGVSACLRMRVFATSDTADAYPISSFSDVTHWTWRMDSDFDRDTPYKVNADNENIAVQTVTETVNGKSVNFTEFAIPISNMNTLELATWLGTDREQASLTGELVGYDSSDNAIFVLQVDGFTVRNRLAGLNEPTANNQEYLTRSQTELMIQSSVASMTATKQDKLTSANAGAGISIDSGGTISMVNVILGATNGVKIASGLAQFDPETAIGASGSSKGAIVTVADGLLVAGGTASINGASLEDVLAGTEEVIVSGSTITQAIRDEVVTPGNLRGALSIAQAVDVSCAPVGSTGTWSYEDGDFLKTITWTFTRAASGSDYFGFINTGISLKKYFPKGVPGLKYLFVADVTFDKAVGLGTAASNTILGSWTGKQAGGVTRHMAMIAVATRSGSDVITPIHFNVYGADTNGQACVATITHCRQYEVTALTDEAIAFLASQPDPDALFRSDSIASIVGRYLIRQDMVSPWIKTIGMPDNSDLSVAAGLNYKIKYTTDTEHKISVDTIPADAYGRESHIQMFIKGASGIQFQPPLTLMEPLTANAGHNLSVKFRNGQALVYVDDLNAGYIVTVPSGTAGGSLYAGLADATSEYIVFGSTTNGAVCDFGTIVSGLTYNVNVLGNGPARTTITGTVGPASGKTMNLQDLTVTGGTISGAGTVDLTNVTIGDCDLDPAVIAFRSGRLNGTVRSGMISVYGTVGSDRSGVVSDLHGGGQDNLFRFSADGASVSDMIVDGATVNGCIFGTKNNNGQTYFISNCLLKDNRSVSENGCVFFVGGTTVCLSGTTISGGSVKTNASGTGGFVRWNGVLTASNCTWENNQITLYPESGITNRMNLGGTITLSDSYISGAGEVTIAANTVIDVSSSVTRTAANRVIQAQSDSSPINVVIGGSMSLIAVSGTTSAIDACTCAYFTYGGIFYDNRGSITVASTAADPWRATNVIFGSPLDASAASTVRLSGTTFTGGSLISNPPARIQLPAGSTNSFAGNTNSSGARILQAPVIVVGNNPAAPSGSATIVASGSTPSISGIGTYVAKNGGNDFTALSNVKSVTVSSGASTVASSLASALALTTSTGGVNRWVKLANGLTATAIYANGATVTDKRIITAEYEPVLAGSFSFSSGASVSVDEAAKTTTITGATMVMSSVEIPFGATVKVSGGSLSVGSVSAHGGTIELAGNATIQMTGGTVGHVTISSGATVNITSGIVPGGVIVLCGGTYPSSTTIVYSGGSRTFEDLDIRGTTITNQGIVYGATVYSNVGDDHNIYFTGDGGATSSSVIVTGQTEYVVSGGLVQISGT